MSTKAAYLATLHRWQHERDPAKRAELDAMLRALAEQHKRETQHTRNARPS